MIVIVDAVDCDDLEATEEYSISKPPPASSELIELVNVIMRLMRFPQVPMKD